MRWPPMKSQDSRFPHSSSPGVDSPTNHPRIKYGAGSGSSCVFFTPSVSRVRHPTVGGVRLSSTSPIKHGLRRGCPARVNN